ncbi:MAG: ADP-ribosylglycohydrolase family protein [Actinophytocola sp.]|nr:ADP-ribosylglycohydrolase family protein [Actinophytocola sp.]
MPGTRGGPDDYGFEYADPAFVVEHNTLAGYVQHPTHLDLRPGCYTDGTQMSIAIAEALVSGEPWTPQRVAHRFVETFHRARRVGYSGRFYELLLHVEDGHDLLTRINPASDKSGAAMRAGPIGLLSEVSDVLHYADVQARITHDTPDGIEAAQAAALAVHYCHYDVGPMARIGNWIDERLRAAGGAGDWARPWHGRVGPQGRMSVRAALTALTVGASLSDVLHTSVAYTGDVDTVATIALAAASRSTRITDDLPKSLLDGLENGPYGYTFLRNLDIRLQATCGTSRSRG